MEGREILRQLIVLARMTGQTIVIPDQGRSFKIQGVTGDLGRAYWGGVGFEPLDGQTERELPNIIAALDASEALFISQDGSRKLVPKGELLTDLG